MAKDVLLWNPYYTVSRDLFVAGGINIAKRFEQRFPTYQDYDGIVHHEVPGAGRMVETA